jgi:ankyrin repeat protein
MALADDLLEAFEYHSPEKIQAVLDAGASPLELIKGKTPMVWLIEFYPRTSRFADCIRVMLRAGAIIEDPDLQAILLDDAAQLSPAALTKRFHLECTYTSLHDVSALHVCAEYNSVECAKALLARGVEVDVRAGIDADGLGGHTPLFHTVNSNGNHCRPMMELLVEAGASLDLRLKGLVWADGFDWETVVFDVTPISYAQCGLYSQFHRKQPDVYSNIDYLYRKRYGVAAPARNVPNKYLA